jgi:hypothetical protein
MAASRCEPTPLHPTSAGSSPTGATLVNRASPTSRRWSRSIRVSNMPIDALSKRASTSLRPLSTSTGSPMAYAATGVWRACTGCSTSSSRTIFPLPYRSRRQEHGRRAPLRARSRPRQQIQAQRQNKKKIRRLEPGLPPRTAAAQVSVNLDSVPCVNLAGLKITNANLAGASISQGRMEGMTIEGILVSDLLAAYRASQSAGDKSECPGAGPSGT